MQPKKHATSGREWKFLEEIQVTLEEKSMESLTTRFRRLKTHFNELGYKNVTITNVVYGESSCVGELWGLAKMKSSKDKKKRDDELRKLNNFSSLEWGDGKI